MSFQTAIKYPSDLTTPPHEKWILLEAKSGRHIARDGFVAEAGNNPDRTLAAVALYLPTDALKSAHTVGYKDIDLGMAAGKAIEAATTRQGTLRAPTQTSGTGFNIDTLKSAMGGFIEGAATQKLLDVTESFAGMAIDNPRETGEIVAGGAVNPRTDTAFDAMQYRTHEFTFNLIPRDKREADDIDAILNILHFYSLPSYGDGRLGNFMIGYPYEFVITMFKETHLNKIERSVLTGITVDHAGGDRIAFASSAAAAAIEYYPAATSLSLSFKEVRLLGRDSEVIFRGEPGPDARPPGIGDDPRVNPTAPPPTTVYQDQFDEQRRTAAGRRAARTIYGDQYDDNGNYIGN
jgi:hypothetical protein